VSIGVLLAAARSADAYELSGGVSLGGILVGTVPRLTVSPHGGFSWSREGGFLFAVHDVCNLVPGTGMLGFGVYNQTSASVGYVSKQFDLSLGPSLSVYSLPACGATLCGRVVGLAPGGRVETNLYFAGALGVSASGSLDWVGGQSLVLPGGWAAMVVVGPVLRWGKR
jgi:hypothetical protein